MNSEHGDSNPKALSGSSNPKAENSGYTGLDATTTMQKSPDFFSKPSTRPLLDYNPHESDFRSTTTSNDEAPATSDKPSPWEVIATTDPKNVSEKHKFARVEAAYARPIEGPVSIPGCVLRRKPNILRLVKRQSPDKSPADSSHDAALQALKTPLAPVNKETMKELELGAIQNNTSLRIDLCFDDQLYFQPIKGRKGEDKQRRARVFWDCLSLELDAYRHDLRGNCFECAKVKGDRGVSDVQIPSRLAEFFSALRDLIEMLVPDKDKASILTHLDVDHLVRMARVGTFDAVQFSSWLAQLLMTHCAPLRDGMAKKMNQQISDGAQTNNMDLLVKGLETLLSLLENMKLDVANHQVRSFKLLLIADTVPFLQDCFSKMRSVQQSDLKVCRTWFQETRRKHCDTQASDFEIFVSGTVMLCKSPCKAMPSTFSYDKERLVCLRNEVLDLTQLRICIDTFEEFVATQQDRQANTTEIAEVSDRLLQLMCSEDGNSEGVACHLDEIATEIARAARNASTEVQPRATNPQARDLDLQHAVDRLETRLQDEQFTVMNQVLDELTERTMYHAFQFQKLDTLQISNAQRVWTANRSSKNLVPTPDIEDIARRLAHIIVIHWSVWAKLVYQEDD